jgi:hypothetical protein
MNREWNSSGVMQEFIKIAAESGLITSDLQQKELAGNADKDTPVKDHRRYEPTEEYELEVEGGNLVEKAHPEEAWMAKNSTPVKSMGKGSLVENVKEQQEKDIEVATRMPSGALPGVHAAVVAELAKLASQLDGEEKYKEATRIDKTIARLGRLPFVDSCLRKEAWIGNVIFTLLSFAPFAYNYFFNKGTVTTTVGKPDVGKGKTVTKTKAPMKRGGRIATIIGLGLTALTFFGKRMTSTQEGIKTDIKDLYEILNKASNESVAAKMAAAKLAPYVKVFEKSPQKPEDYETYRQKIVELKSLLPSVKRDIENTLETDIESGTWTWTGLDLHSRISEKLSTWESDLAAVKTKGANLDRVARTAEVARKSEYTPDELRQLENRLDRDTNTLYNKKVIRRKPKGGFKGKIVKDNKLVMNKEKLERIVSLVDQLIAKYG